MVRGEKDKEKQHKEVGYECHFDGMDILRDLDTLDVTKELG